LRIALWSGVGLTAASAIATVGLYGGALDAAKDFKRAQCGESCMPGDSFPFAEEDRYQRLTQSTRAMLGVTASLAAITVTLAIVRAVQYGKQKQARRTTGVRARWLGNGLVVRW
jgi:hypothetical protein